MNIITDYNCTTCPSSLPSFLPSPLLTSVCLWWRELYSFLSSSSRSSNLPTETDETCSQFKVICKMRIKHWCFSKKITLNPQEPPFNVTRKEQHHYFKYLLWSFHSCLYCNTVIYCAFCCCARQAKGVISLKWASMLGQLRKWQKHLIPC